MKNFEIIEALANTVEKTIYDAWHHEGYIAIMHSDDFRFALDGKMYEVVLKECSEEVAL